MRSVCSNEDLFSRLGNQGYGRPLWVVHGFFKANGGCGYVRKPKFLFPSENGGQEFDPRVAKAPVVTLKVSLCCLWK